MAVQALNPLPVRSVANLTQDEVDKYNTVWLVVENKLRENLQIPEANRETVIEDVAMSVNNFALNRGFYSQDAAQQTEIDVLISPKIIVQKPETLKGAIKKTIIQTIFGTLGWTIAEFNPIIGIALTATGSIVNSDAYKQKTSELCSKY